MAEIYGSREWRQENPDYDPIDYADEWDDLEEPNGVNGAVHPDDRTEEQQEEQDNIVDDDDSDPIPF